MNRRCTTDTNLQLKLFQCIYKRTKKSYSCRIASLLFLCVKHSCESVHVLSLVFLWLAHVSSTVFYQVALPTVCSRKKPHLARFAEFGFQANIPEIGHTKVLQEVLCLYFQTSNQRQEIVKNSANIALHTGFGAYSQVVIVYNLLKVLSRLSCSLPASTTGSQHVCVQQASRE